MQVLKSGSPIATFTYDPFGRRVSKTTSVGTVYYVYDGEDILAEVDGAGTLLTYYVHGPGIDVPLAMIRGGQTYYYHADALGTITHLTNSTGAVVQSYEYDSFGNITAQSGTISQPYTYTAREWDAETGLYYYRARYYDSQVGRFITEDPIGIGGGINFFTYVLNDPMNFSDPFGLDKCCDYPDLKNAIKFYKKINKAVQAGNCGKAMDPIVRAWQECYKEFEQCKTLEDQLKFYDKYTDTAFVSFAVLGCVKKKSGDPKVFSKWFEACIKVAY